MAQTNHYVFALDWPLAHEAQGFALDKVFHWRSTTVLAYKPMLIFVNLYISI
jgi:hypothetical protein